jgi:hypothetical protein
MQTNNVEPVAPVKKHHVTADQIAAVLSSLEAGFGDDSAVVSRVAIVTGAGAKVRIHDGKLLVEDGEVGIAVRGRGAVSASFAD